MTAIRVSFEVDGELVFLSGRELVDSGTVSCCPRCGMRKRRSFTMQFSKASFPAFLDRALRARYDHRKREATLTVEGELET